MMRKGTALAPDFSNLRGKHILIALSGGADSVALAVMLAEAREALALRLSAAHLDHAIRPESAGDAEWCRALCHRLSITFHTARIDVPAEAKRAGEGLETAARRLRHLWLDQVKEAVGADCVALAHHMDDQAETVLMHLARGTGPEGIGGMRAQTDGMVRPLLGMRKRELTAYLLERGIGWREDATNAVDDTPRNALRLHGIPELEKSYPQIVPAISRYAESARIESDYLAELTREYLAARRFSGPYGDYIDLAPPPSRAILRRALRQLCGSGLPWEKLNALEALCAAERGKLEISGSLTAERGHRGIYFLPKRPASIVKRPLSLTGETVLDGLCAVAAAPAPPITVRDDPLRQALDADALSGAALRVRRDGDRIRPLGCGEKLLSDYLTDKKVDRPLRDCLAVVAKGNRVLWVCGLGISEEAKLTDQSTRAVALECRYTFETAMLYK
ncbi:MAG: tRNA lysidine(34) synthetase TilS [Clostridia bacterium]|nr:tRNA lysidine(34) synthetase TilS [Clostridia bacterium]